jgi:TM2 domain-containing membrane protein YozV
LSESAVDFHLVSRLGFTGENTEGATPVSYYIAVGADRKGPFPKEQLLAEGLRADTLVWTEGMADWQAASTVPELSDLFAQPQPAPYPDPAARALPYATPGQPIGYQSIPPYNQSEVNGKKIAAGLCGILLGALGIHKFVLGFTSAGIIMIVCTFGATILTCGMAAPIVSIIGLIEGILYLTKSDEQFYQDYFVNRKQWF